MRLGLCIFLTLLLACETDFLSMKSVIETSSGPLLGVTINFNGITVNQYLGIPYAEPPIGELRFRKPQPIKPWSDVWAAIKAGPACMQYEVYHYPWYDAGDYKSENCLYLNIWVPESKIKNSNSEKMSVMFWIYGGGFTVGSNRIPFYNGLALAAEGNVIVVTANYRVSSLGFLTSGTETAPGNVGLYDVLESLKWVNENINAFGGDPKQITLFGESAGAVFTGLLCVSPLAKGLFSRIILESGSPAYLGAENNTANIVKSQRIAEILGCADDVSNIYNKPDKVVNCLRGQRAIDLITAVYSFRSSIYQSFEPNYGDEILPINPRIAIATGQFQDVNVLIGNNQDEGSFKVAALKPQLFGAFGEKNPQINKELGASLLDDFFKDLPAKKEVIEYYLKDINEANYDEIREQVYTAMGDFRILCPTKYFAESYSRYGNKVFYYFYVHRPSVSPWAKWMKVAHFDEVQFVFGMPLLDPSIYTNEEIHFSLRLINIWTNFAKYGSPECPNQPEYPESSWLLYSRERPVYVTLGAEIKKGTKGYGRGPHEKNCDFFRQTLDSYYKRI